LFLSHTTKDLSFRPKQFTVHRELRSGEICFSTSTFPSNLNRSPAITAHLHLLLQVPPVILNAVKDPEEFHSPQTLGPFNRYSPPVAVVCPLLPDKRIVISTEAAGSLTVRRAVEKSKHLPLFFLLQLFLSRLLELAHGFR
jgi:hypothetical protein